MFPSVFCEGKVRLLYSIIDRASSFYFFFFCAKQSSSTVSLISSSVSSLTFYPESILCDERNDRFEDVGMIFFEASSSK